MIRLGGIENIRICELCVSYGFRDFLLDVSQGLNRINYQSIFKLNEEKKGLNKMYEDLYFYCLIEKDKLFTTNNDRINDSNCIDVLQEYLNDFLPRIKEIIYLKKDLDYFFYLNQQIQKENKNIKIKTISHKDTGQEDYCFDYKKTTAIPVGYTLTDNCISYYPNYFRKKRYILYIDNENNFQKDFLPESMTQDFKEKYLKYGHDISYNKDDNDWDDINISMIKEYKKILNYRVKDVQIITDKNIAHVSPCYTCSFRNTCKHSSLAPMRCAIAPKDKINLFNKEQIRNINNDLFNDVLVEYYKLKEFNPPEARKYVMEILKFMNKGGAININVNTNVEKKEKPKKIWDADDL